MVLEMAATTVHLPLASSCLTRSPSSIATSIRTFRDNQIVRSTYISNCRNSSFKLCCIRNNGNREPSQVCWFKFHIPCKFSTEWLSRISFGWSNSSSINKCLTLQDFSILKTDLQCDIGNTWSTMAFYIFSLHIPLSFGGLSVVAKLLHQTDLDPNTQVIQIKTISIFELCESSFFFFYLFIFYHHWNCWLLTFHLSLTGVFIASNTNFGVRFFPIAVKILQQPF